MQKNRGTNGGYMGFIALLLSLAIIGFIMWKNHLFIGGVNIPSESGEGEDVKAFDTQINAVQRAKDAKLRLEAEARGDLE